MKNTKEALKARLEELAEIKEGWLGDDQGKSLDPETTGYVTIVGEWLIERGIYFYTFLTPDGGIQLEYFDSKPWATTIEFIPQSRTVYFHTCSIDEFDFVFSHQFAYSDGHLKNKIYTLLKLFGTKNA